MAGNGEGRERSMQGRGKRGEEGKGQEITSNARNGTGMKGGQDEAGKASMQREGMKWQVRDRNRNGEERQYQERKGQERAGKDTNPTEREWGGKQGNQRKERVRTQTAGMDKGQDGTGLATKE